MILVEGNMINPLRYSKRCQGSYELVRSVSEVEYVVWLLGDDDEYWRRMCRLTDPIITITKEMKETAYHDKQKFLVESFED